MCVHAAVQSALLNSPMLPAGSPSVHTTRCLHPPPPPPQMSLLLWMNMTPSLALVIEWLDESTLGPAVRHGEVGRRGAAGGGEEG